jgi:hypothetical protein
MMMRAIPVADVAAPLVGAALPDFDAYDQPAIVIGDDAVTAIDLCAILQSRGFDVLQGTEASATDDEPVLIVIGAAPATTRQRLDRFRSIWPFAPVISVADSADALVQLAPIFS